MTCAGKERDSDRAQQITCFPRCPVVVLARVADDATHLLPEFAIPGGWSIGQRGEERTTTYPTGLSVKALKNCERRLSGVALGVGRSFVDMVYCQPREAR